MKKKYFWFRMMETFFDQQEICSLMNEKKGADALCFYLRLACRATSGAGKIQKHDYSESVSEEIAALLNEKRSKTEKNLQLLEKFSLIRYESDGSAYLPKIAEFIGSEWDSAERMRKMRASQSDKKVTERREEKRRKEKEKSFSIFEEQEQQELTDEELAKEGWS